MRIGGTRYGIPISGGGTHNLRNGLRVHVPGIVVCAGGNRFRPVPDILHIDGLAILHTPQRLVEILLLLPETLLYRLEESVHFQYRTHLPELGVRGIDTCLAVAFGKGDKRIPYVILTGFVHVIHMVSRYHPLR